MKALTYICIASLLLSISVVAQESYSNQISVEQQSIVKNGQNLDISMILNFSNLELNSQHMITLTPVLVSADNTQSKTLPPIVVNGNRRNKIVY